MSTHNIGFYEDLTKIIFQLSSNTHLISSSAKSNPSQQNDLYFKVIKGANYLNVGVF